jgi:hypothetical protein
MVRTLREVSSAASCRFTSSFAILSELAVLMLSDILFAFHLVVWNFSLFPELMRLQFAHDAAKPKKTHRACSR